MVLPMIYELLCGAAIVALGILSAVLFPIGLRKKARRAARRCAKPSLPSS